MNLLADLLFFLTATVYGAASLLFFAHLAGRGGGARSIQIAPHLVAGGACLHAVQVLASSFATNTCPVTSIHFSLSVLSMVACMAYAAFRRRAGIEVVGAFVAPLALTFLLASRFVGGGREDPSSGMGRVFLPVHVAANLLGDALFMLAFGAATLYLVQDNRLKRKKLVGVYQRLPPLEALDRAEHRFLLAGFPMLTVGILTGTLWARHVEAGSAMAVWRAASGYLSWIFFAGVLLLRAAAGWHGRRAAYGTIAGFGFAVLVLLIYLWRSVSEAAVA